MGCQSESKESDEAIKKGLDIMAFGEEPDYRKAQEYFAEAVLLNPENITAYLWKADAEIKLGNFDQCFKTAQMALTKVDSKHAHRPYFLIYAGLSAQMLGENGDSYMEEAVVYYNKRLEEDIRDLDAIMNKAYTLCYLRRKEEAMVFLNTLSVNQEDQASLKQIIESVQSFNADEVLTRLTN